jgi:tRNA pseudouridine38-40 synthase
MATYRLLIEYEGTRYSGWQTQQNTAKTVQGALLRAASQVFGSADIGGSGRTDAGVHAAGQVAHLRVARAVPPAEIGRKLNDLLPHDIHVLRVTPAPGAFHARHDAALRVYLYQISRRRSAFAKPFVWWIKDHLDINAMSECAQSLAGMHDFTALADKRASNESTRVLVDFADVGEAGDLILIRIGASHFLWKMVRKIVAALAEVGRGNMRVEEFRELVEGNGPRFQPTAPPSGLFLEAVTFEGEVFDRPLAPIVPVDRPFIPKADPQWRKTKKR